MTINKQPLATFFRPGHNKAWLRRLIAVLVIVALVVSGFFSIFAPRAAAAPLKRSLAVLATNVVISEFRTRGPSGDNDEFIEIFNPTDNSIDISGWKIWGWSPATFQSVRFSFPVLTSIASGQHILVTNSNLLNGPYSGLVIGDFTYNNGIPNNGGLAITKDDDSYVDGVGLNSASPFIEGTLLTPLTTDTNQSYERLPGGLTGSCNDNNDNSTDFQLLNPSNPENSISASTSCSTIIQTATAEVVGTQTAAAGTAAVQTALAAGTQNAVAGTQTAAAGTQTGVAQTATAGWTLTPPTATPGLTPTLRIRSVVINEVAWSGTKANPTDEWIELYNPGSTAIILDNWQLFFTSTSWITLPSSIIPAGGYFLLERNDDATVSDIPADYVYSGPLTEMINAGGTLELFDNNGNLMDQANANAGGWPQGTASPSFCSMERISATAADSDGNWRSNNNINKNGRDQDGNLICGTPKRINSLLPTLTPAKTRTRTPTAIAGTFIPSTIVINEFLPHARSDWNGDGRVDAGDEFIEIKNVSTQAFSLSGWRLDDDTGDSSAFNLPDVSIEGGARLVFFASETKILLSNGGETVRLYKNTGSISDAFTYGVVLTPDQTWCRFPDGLNTWRFGCEPTPQEANRLAQTIVVDNQTQSKFCLSPTILPVVYQAECTPSGLDMWSRSFWEWQLQAGFPLYIQPNEQEFITE